ncbi:hypothetical protein HYS96_04035 [Candidatus Daviesbacteria bacterium]|nr:hypothetical protein [Candidatus Daviesbacteria bacterium]
MKLLGIISLILTIVLFPPAALAVISNNAAPGDATYPIKRGLEDVIYAVASLTPTSKAWFAAARSDRRFQEVTVLITEGKQAKETLNELVVQTDIAAGQINQITDQKQKEQLINQLSQSIEKYDQGLQQLTAKPSIPPAVLQPAITPSPTPSAETIPSPTPKATPVATVRPTPLPTVQPTSTPLPTVEPTPRPNRQEEEKEKQRRKEIEEARKRLEEIKKKLEEERQRSQKQDNRQETRKEDSNLTPKEHPDKIRKEKQ